MRKITMIMMVMVMVMGAVCYGAPEGKIENVFLDEKVGSASESTSRAFMCKSGGYFGAWIQATTPAPGQGLHTPDIEISYQMSYDKTIGFTTPTTTVFRVDGLRATTPTVVSISPPPMKYIRFIVSDNGSNTTGTTVTMKLFTQE